MADPKGFLRHRDRELPARRPVPVRLLDWREVYEQREEDGPALVRQASRCMDCGIPFCHNGCPLGNLIPEWNELTRLERWDEAIERLHATNNFPEFTGRLCPAPCETSCVLGINQPAVTIKNIEQSIIDRAFEDGLVEPQVPGRLTAFTVAVVGSGPAGMAAAQQLTRSGHTVAVYERDEGIGGLMRYGVPDFKMEKVHIDRRVAQMEAEGTRFRTGVNVGFDEGTTGQDLLERYDAVILATGATVSRELPIPGRELVGVHQAMDYLPQANRVVAGTEVADQILATDKDVVIIGAGDTAADCLGTALRQAARSVTELAIGRRPGDDRAPEQPWPTYPTIYRVSNAHEEGGDRRYDSATAELVGDENGEVVGLRVAETEHVDGQRLPRAGTEVLIDAQLVLLAMGYVSVETPGLVEQLELEVDARGRVVRDADFATSVPGVFVAGDAGRGQSLIVWAIAEGRAAAAAVDRHLRGHTELPAPIEPTTVSIVV